MTRRLGIFLVIATPIAVAAALTYWEKSLPHPMNERYVTAHDRGPVGPTRPILST